MSNLKIRFMFHTDTLTLSTRFVYNIFPLGLQPPLFFDIIVIYRLPEYNEKTKLVIEPESSDKKPFVDYETYYPTVKFNIALIRDPRSKMI